MSEFQNRMAQAAQPAAGGSPIENVLSHLMGGRGDASGLEHLTQRLRGNGLGHQVDSWIGTGENEPVSPQQLEQAIGPEEAQRLSAGAGIPQSGLMSILAMLLPMLVNRATPSGHMPTGNEMPSGGLGGILGGLMGGGGLGGMLGGMLGGNAAQQQGQDSGSGGGLGGMLGGLLGGGAGQPQGQGGGGLGGMLGGMLGGRPGADPRNGHTEEELGGFWQSLTRGR